MPVMVQALTPVFVLILLGYLFRRWHFPGDDFWIQAERFTYYVLFPVMLIFKLGQARLPPSAYGDILILIAAMLVSMTLVLAALQWIWRWPGPVFRPCSRVVSALIPMWPWRQPVCCSGMKACL